MLVKLTKLYTTLLGGGADYAHTVGFCFPPSGGYSEPDGKWMWREGIHRNPLIYLVQIAIMVMVNFLPTILYLIADSRGLLGNLPSIPIWAALIINVILSWAIPRPYPDKE